jgi:hypothetical protein
MRIAATVTIVVLALLDIASTGCSSQPHDAAEASHLDDAHDGADTSVGSDVAADPDGSDAVTPQEGTDDGPGFEGYVDGETDFPDDDDEGCSDWSVGDDLDSPCPEENRGGDDGDGDFGPPPPCPTGSKCDGLVCCTCSGTDCEQGIDNSLSGIASLANSALQGVIDSGDLNLIAELSVDAGDTFALNFYTAGLDPSDGDCNVGVGPCQWQLGLEAFDAECRPLYTLKDATIDTQGKLTAGGPDGLFVLSLPIQSFVLELEIVSARIEGQVTTSGDVITGMSGILAGVVPKVALAAAVDKLPSEGLPLPKPAIKNLLDKVIRADVDALDAEGKPGTDGVKESASIAIRFAGVPGVIASVESTEGQDPAAACVEPPAIESFSPLVFRMTTLALGESGKVGQGLDVDGWCDDPPSPETCQ